jgi:hypothetical protein
MAGVDSVSMFKTVKSACAASLALALAAIGGTAHANPESLAYFTQGKSEALPDLLSGEEKLYYRSFFEAVETRNWSRVEELITQRSSGPLHGAALAAYYLDPASPQIALERLTRWLDSYSDLPQAEAVVRLAERRGLTDAPRLAASRDLVRQPGITRRTKPRAVNDGTMPASIENAIRRRITGHGLQRAIGLLGSLRGGLAIARAHRMPFAAQPPEARTSN